MEESTKADDRTYYKRCGFLGKLARFDPFQRRHHAERGGWRLASRITTWRLQASQDALKDCGKLDLEPVNAVAIRRGTYVNRGDAAAMQQVQRRSR